MFVFQITMTKQLLTLSLLLLLFSGCSKEEVEPNVNLYDASLVKELIDGKKKFNILHFSDVHYFSRNSDVNFEELILFANKPEIKNELSAIVSTGDVSNGSASKGKTSTLDEISAYVSRALTSPVTFLNVIGNHDDNINYIGTVTTPHSMFNALNKNEQHELLIKPFASRWPEIVAEPGVGYYYADFKKFKIRVISLDAYDYPLAGKADGTIKYWVSGHYFSQGQLDWLYETLQSTPNDYGLMVLSHAPFTTGFTIGTYIQGVKVIPSIINAYRNGTSYSHNHRDKAFPELSTKKVFDFSGSKAREFICYLGGHIHNLQFLQPDDFPDQHAIIMPNMWTNPGGKMHRDSEQTRNSFGFISVDREKKSIGVVVYGGYQNKSSDQHTRVKLIDY